MHSLPFSFTWPARNGQADACEPQARLLLVSIMNSRGSFGANDRGTGREAERSGQLRNTRGEKGTLPHILSLRFRASVRRVRDRVSVSHWNAPRDSATRETSRGITERKIKRNGTKINESNDWRRRDTVEIGSDAQFFTNRRPSTLEWLQNPSSV